MKFEKNKKVKTFEDYGCSIVKKFRNIDGDVKRTKKAIKHVGEQIIDLEHRLCALLGVYQFIALRNAWSCGVFSDENKDHLSDVVQRHPYLIDECPDDLLVLLDIVKDD